MIIQDGKLVTGSNSIRQKPIYPIDLWNVFEQTVIGVSRTNNSLESWHKQFAQNVSSHPDVNDLVKKVR